MSKLKNFCQNLSRKSKAKSAKKRAAKLEKRMDKKKKKADKICRKTSDFDVLANKIFDKRDYRIHMSKFKAHNYKFEED